MSVSDHLADDYSSPEEFLARLTDLGGYSERLNGAWVIQCPHPDHPDVHPSASLMTGRKGQPLVYCHSCNPRESDDPKREQAAWFRAAVKRLRDGVAFVPAEPRSRNGNGGGDSPRVAVAHYDYPTSAATYRKVRYVHDNGGKSFGWQRRVGEAWVDGLNRKPMEELPLFVCGPIAEASVVYWVEGEKDAERVADEGGVAVTSPGGASGPLPDDLTPLAGKAVIVVADRDPAGVKYARRVADAVEGATLAQPAIGKDVSDHLDHDFTLAQLDFGTATPMGDGVEVATDEAFPVLDWHTLWSEPTTEEWIAEPLVPAGRLVALYSAPKVGKSLLMLEVAVRVSRGEGLFGYPEPESPSVVLYVDFENDPRGDIRERLSAMGYGPDDLGNLRYLSFPALAALDSEEGARQLVQVAESHAAALVVVDTISRAVRGPENENDTWLDFYRHTGVALKRAGLALIRLDHSGKDETKGQRGASAKSGDVDAVWRLSSLGDESLRLECTDARFMVSEKVLDLRRESRPLRHVVDMLASARVWAGKVSAAVADLDTLGVDASTGYRAAATQLRDANLTGHSFRAVKDAQERRRELFGGAF